MSASALLALAAAASGVPPSPAADAPVAIPRALDAVQMLALAEEARMRGNPEFAEAIYRAMFVDPSPDVASEARFRVAMLESGRGRLREAALLLRRVLDDRLNAQRARFELAGVLAKLGDEQSALRELREPGSVALMVNELTEESRHALQDRTVSLVIATPLRELCEELLAIMVHTKEAGMAETPGQRFLSAEIWTPESL